MTDQQARIERLQRKLHWASKAGSDLMTIKRADLEAALARLDEVEFDLENR